MKLLAKSSFTILLMLFIVNISFAQKRKKVPYNAVIIAEGKRFHGKISSITETHIVLTDKKDVAQNIPYQNINRITIHKSHSDAGYAVITGALVAGAIVAGQSVDDANVAVLVGVGGTAAVVGLSMALHNVIHGAEAKMKAKKEKIDYTSVSQKLSKYIVSDNSQ